MTKYKLFKDLKLTKGHEYSWFNQHRTPSTNNYIRIADYLGVSIDELVGRV
ncbi:MAG: helix-turn-helix transcriptional regulator [Clostridia bacterium]|nr:helix-turn-helix transcriptional regulator [Clostridia bacterium]